ncbi:MAG: hypothetical protein KDD70_02940 [Bdellovibrionales bacterium]|nr:hypothetical protein [Bdellovibrionales bacterium]
MIRNILLSLSLLTLCCISGCSTVYDNTIGLFAGNNSTPQGQETGSEDVVDGNTVSDSTPGSGALANTTERIDSAKATTAKVAVEGSPSPAIQTPSDEVEVLWKIPEEPVEGFVLKYGFDRQSLSEEIALGLNQIEKYDDPEFGFVYRYVLKNIPPSQKVFVRLATRTDGKLTPFSEVFEVAAE